MSAETLQTSATKPKWLGAPIGLTAVLHTCGQARHYAGSPSQVMDDDPMHVMMRQILALFYKYEIQGKHQARHPYPEGKFPSGLLVQSEVASAASGT